MTTLENPVTGRWIDIPSFDGKTFQAYLALPPVTPRKAPAPGVIVLQEIWGVNAHMRSVADQYAGDGYVVLAPDLFWRMQPRVDLGYDEDGTKLAYGYRKSIDLALADRDIAATADMLRSMTEVAGGIGVVGYCMGGMLAYRSAAHGSVDAAVCYYGGGIAQQLDLAPSITAPMSLHFGELDAHITAEHVASIQHALAGHANVTIDTYAGADHGFNCWARPSYHQRAAALAHGRALAFLSNSLEGA